MSQNPPENPYGEQQPPPPPPYGQQAGGAYPQGQPGQPYPPQGQPQGGSGLAIAALVVGILALLFSWTVVGGIIGGIVALILGLVASGKAKRGTATGRGMAITGIVLGVIGALISIGIIVVTALFLNSDSFSNLQDCVNNAQTQADQQQCQDEFQDNVTN